MQTFFHGRGKNKNTNMKNSNFPPEWRRDAMTQLGFWVFVLVIVGSLGYLFQNPLSFSHTSAPSLASPVEEDQVREVEGQKPNEIALKNLSVSMPLLAQTQPQVPTNWFSSS